MRFTLATVLAVIPLLTIAAPYPHGTTIPLTKRSSLTKSDGSVDLAALKRHLAITTAKLTRGITNYEKNTGQRHSGADAAEKIALTKRATGADSLTDEGSGQLWQGTISIGTPAVEYTIDFDTGSSDLFLPGPDCTDDNCSGHTQYIPANSSTSKSVGKTFSLSYGDGSTVSGDQYTDTVTIAGLTADTQTLGAASTYSSGFALSSFSPDGLMGMAFKSISDYDANPLFQTLVADGVTTDSVFAFKLTESDGSSLYLGGVDTTQYTGDISYADVTEEGYWQVDMDAVSAQGTQVLGTTSSIIDTGTTLLIGVPSDVAEIYAAISGAESAADTVGEGYYTFPCDSIPTISITFGGTEFNVSTDSLNIGTTEAGSSTCVGGLVGADIGNIGWIVGDVFLQNTYTVFDYGNKRVGFATLA